MNDFKALTRICQEQTNFTLDVIDDFLINHAISRDKVDREFQTKNARFRHAYFGAPQGLMEMFEKQYICHQLFKKEGLIAKYLNHAALRQLTDDQRSKLVYTIEKPWRFSFCEIIDNPAPDFFLMQDLFSDETFLLYSQNLKQLSSTGMYITWFLLIGHNGHCWQAFGQLTGMMSFDEDDLFFYGTELNPSIETEEDLLDDIEENPVHYMMVMAGSTYPVTIGSGYEIVRVVSEISDIQLDIDEFKPAFQVEQEGQVFKLTDEQWSTPPHFGEVYYDAGKELLMVGAFTDFGYIQMVEKLNEFNIYPPEEPELRVHLSMVTLIEKLLKKKLELEPYTKMFHQPDSKNESLDNLNAMISAVLTEMNAGGKPDIESLAAEFDVDPELAAGIMRTIIQKMEP